MPQGKGGRKLKVYLMPAGFHDAVVAAPSQTAALKAWGMTTDLFAAGRAWLVDDEATRAEALARPGEVIKRPRGDEKAMLGPEPKEAFRPAPPKQATKARRATKSAKPDAPPRPPPDRSKLDAAERDLADAEADLEVKLGDLAVERADLDRRETEARREGEKRVAELRRAKERAETAFERAANDNRTKV